MLSEAQFLGPEKISVLQRGCFFYSIALDSLKIYQSVFYHKFTFYDIIIL